MSRDCPQRGGGGRGGGGGNCYNCGQPGMNPFPSITFITTEKWKSQTEEYSNCYSNVHFLHFQGIFLVTAPRNVVVAVAAAVAVVPRSAIDAKDMATSPAIALINRSLKTMH